MKKLGLIGGMSWESSLEYYRQLNMGVKKALGGFHSCNCIMESVDFAEVAKLQHEGDWLKLQELMVSSARNLENAGAQLLVLCTNTMHAVSKAIEENVNIPFIHIASATGARINLLEIDNVLLLGTRFTMAQDFYKDILESDYGISVSIPAGTGRRSISREVTFGSRVLSANVALNGFKLDFSNSDKHINIVEADVDRSSISGNTVTIRVECNYADKNFDDPYSGYVTALVIAEVA